MASDRWFPGVVRTWIEAVQEAAGGVNRLDGPGGLDDAVSAGTVDRWLRGLETAGRSGVLHAAATVAPESLGMLGFAWAGRPSVREGLGSLSRYLGLLHPSLGLRLEDDGRWTTAVLSLPVDAPDDLVTRSTVEFLFAYVAHRTRGIGGSGLSKVVFRHEPAVGGDVYGVVFEAVEFGGERNGLVMPSSLLDGRLPPSDGPTAERVRRGILRALKGLPPVQATAVQVREIIVDELMGGIPPMTRVASRLGMTMPVLAQLLRGEGETFAGLREQLLYRLALEYLDESELALVDVAFATGFVDFGVFERTFARWSGRSLASWRKGA